MNQTNLNQCLHRPIVSVLSALSAASSESRVEVISLPSEFEALKSLDKLSGYPVAPVYTSLQDARAGRMFKVTWVKASEPFWRAGSTSLRIVELEAGP